MNGRKSGHVKRYGCDLHALIDSKGESGPMDVEGQLGRINLIPGIYMNRTSRRRLIIEGGQVDHIVIIVCIYMYGIKKGARESQSSKTST